MEQHNGQLILENSKETVVTLNIHIKRSALRGVVQPITDNIHNSTFYMGDQSRNSKLHFGMGLYITNSIMEQHNGQLILENPVPSSVTEISTKPLLL